MYGNDQTVFYKTGDPAVWDRGRELGMTNRIDRVPACMRLTSRAALAQSCRSGSGRLRIRKQGHQRADRHSGYLGRTGRDREHDQLRIDGHHHHLDCASGKSLNVGGSDNTLTVTGTCETATITGANNKITFDKVNTRITVLGMDNTITYKDGDPKVDKIGQSNTINKGG